jgi:hypothetical protein
LAGQVIFTAVEGVRLQRSTSEEIETIDLVEHSLVAWSRDNATLRCGRLVAAMYE